MRAIAVLLITVALAASSGCFGKDDENGDGTDPTPTTPTGTTPTTPTGPTPTTPTDASPTPTTPARPAPREVFSGNADFQRAPNPDPTNPSVSTPNPFSVPTGYTTLTLNVTWAMGTAAGLTNGVSVTVTDAAGTALITCAVADGPQTAAPPACSQTAAIPATGGEYSANYNGEGTIQATVSVVAS